MVFNYFLVYGWRTRHLLQLNFAELKAGLKQEQAFGLRLSSIINFKPPNSNLSRDTFLRSIPVMRWRQLLYHVVYFQQPFLSFVLAHGTGESIVELVRK